VPNPQAGPGLTLSVEFEADADSAIVEVYTKAMARVLLHEIQGPFAAGWNRLDCPVQELSGGLYYVVVSGRLKGAGKFKGPAAKLYWLP
jgi:hypothetical protein